MITCDETNKLLDAFVDQELFLSDSLVIEKHLRVCKQCDAKYKNILAMQQAIKRCKHHAPPAALQDRIQKKLKLETRRKIDFGRFLHDARWFKLALPSFFVGVLTTTIFTFGFLSRSADNGFMDEVVASHIRSMMESHLTDVSSSDKHQIKPWINKVLDYSPPVEDLVRKGYPLIGARLDYINQRKVVSLIYQLRNHYINVFIWPTDKVNEKNLFDRQKGYALQYWTSNQLAYAAVSDLSEGDLLHFVLDFKAAAHNP